MPLLLISSPRFRDHVTPPGHPERPERADVMGSVAQEWRVRGATIAEPRAATRAELLRVHGESHLRAIDDTAGLAAALDSDTYTSPDSRDVALLAAGAAALGVERVLAGEASRAFALVRPPGHHAGRDRAMGFCLYNNVAVAAAHARSLGVERVAIVDYDVHHGNGTQEIFYDDPRVLYLSTHQYPYYPGTGAAGEVGRAAGGGFTVNVPLEAGATDGDYDEVFDAVVVPVLEQFRPALILVSAGFDAHERDPLARMRMSAAGFARLTAGLCRIAERHAGGRAVAVSEGGYDLAALRACLDAAIAVLAGERPPSAAAAPATARSRTAIAAVRAAQAKYWQL